MKVRIQQGSNSIEIEGDKDEVSAILESWWKPSFAMAPANDDPAIQEQGASPKRRTTKRSAPRAPSAARETSSKLNAEDVANRIKEDPRFDLFSKLFVLGEASRSDRAKFVSWFVGDTPITSGDASRVMIALGVKFDAPAASKAMSDSSRDWIKDSSGPQTTFRLSAPARHAFEQKVLNAKPAA